MHAHGISQPLHRRSQAGAPSGDASAAAGVEQDAETPDHDDEGHQGQSGRRSAVAPGSRGARRTLLAVAAVLSVAIVFFGVSTLMLARESIGDSHIQEGLPAGPVDRSRWQGQATATLLSDDSNASSGSGNAGNAISVSRMDVSPLGANYTPQWPLFWILTAPMYEASRCHEIMTTWGTLVPADSLVFLGAAKNWTTRTGFRFFELDAPPEKKAMKEILAWRLVVEAYPTREWYVKGDDDTYFVIGNLNRYLEQYDPRLPYFLGCKFHMGGPGGFQYVSGGAGYVLSREAAARLPRATRKCLSRFGNMTEGDIAAAECLQIVGVFPEDTRDELGHQRFHAFQYEQHVFWYKAGLHANKWWYHDWVWGPMIEGKGCCGNDTTISFHYMASRMRGFKFPDPPEWWMKASKFISDRGIPGAIIPGASAPFAAAGRGVTLGSWRREATQTASPPEEPRQRRRPFLLKGASGDGAAPKEQSLAKRLQELARKKIVEGGTG